MVQFKKKNAGDVYPSARLFDAEVYDFNPTCMGSTTISLHSVENSLFGAAQIDHFRLVGVKLFCCTAAFLIESRP